MTAKTPQLIGEPFDAQWFFRLEPLFARLQHRFKPGNYLDARKKFVQGKDIEPSFSFPHLHDENHEVKRQKLHSLKQDVLKSSQISKTVRELYLDKIDEREKEFKLLTLVRRYLVGHKADLKNDIVALIEDVYGISDKQVFDDLISQLAFRLRQCNQSHAKTKHFKNLVRLLEDVTYADQPLIESIKPKMQNEGHTYTTATEVKDLLNIELKNNGLTKWKAVVNNSKFGNFKVMPTVKKIYVPRTSVLKARKGERQLTERTLAGIIHHEILTHAVRAENGFNSRLKLLGIGLAGYLVGEEGIASYREQKIVGATDYTNINMHFALGIAYGLDRNGKKRNFREVFEILCDYFFVFHNYSGINSRNKAFAACERIFKCATGNGTAFAMTRDRVYREGNIAVHKLINRKPKMEEYFDIGKYDPCNSKHVESLKDLRFIPSDV